MQGVNCGEVRDDCIEGCLTMQTENEVDSRGQRGTLYLVGTPIGNLEDMTLRALRILKEVNVIACEDTRQTQKLLNHFSIGTRTTSYHEHNELTRSAELIMQLERGEWTADGCVCVSRISAAEVGAASQAFGKHQGITADAGFLRGSTQDRRHIRRY